MSVQQKSTNEKIRERLIEMRDKGLIDFTDKKDYPDKIKQVASDLNTSYTHVYDQMKKVAKQKGIMVGKKHEKETKDIKGQKAEFKISAQKSTVDQNRLAKQKAELEAKKRTMETELSMQNMIVKSEAFEMVKTSNTYTLLMFRELVEGLGGKVAEKEKYEMMGGMMAVKEIKSGWQIPDHLETAMIMVGLAGLFIIPLVPQIKKWLSEDDGDNEKKSEEPLDEIPNQNGKDKDAVQNDKPQTS